MRGVLTSRWQSNKESEDYYTGEFLVKGLDIAVQPELAGKLGVVSDWPATVVDSYAERMNFVGWADRRGQNMAGVFERGGIGVAASGAVFDSLVYGVGFLAWEPNSRGEWVARAIPPTEGTVLWDPVDNAPVVGMRRRNLVDGSTQVVLYLPEGVAYVEEEGQKVAGFVPHRLGMPPVVRVRGQMRSRQWYGRSMISPAVRYYTQAACRTLQGMELNREFYTYPQRWLQNGTMDMFVDSEDPTESEKVQAGFRAIAGAMLTLPPPAEPDQPEMSLHQFSSSPPTPFIEQVRAYSQMMASATGIPSSYLGFSTENPPSAEAIRAWLDRLIIACRNQQELISPDLRLFGWFGHVLYGGGSPWEEFATSVRERWNDPATQAVASDADAALKIASLGVPVDSDWIMDRLRLSEDDRQKMRQIEREKKAEELRLRAQQRQVDPKAEELASRRE